MPNPRPSRYGEWTQLHVLRVRSEIERTALASWVGISRQHYFNLEAGHRWPGEDITRRLAQALNVPPAMIERRKRTPAA